MAAATRIHPQSTLAITLLTSLAADIPLRWLSTTSKNNAFPAPLTRTLFSLLLRTSSPFESLSAQKALLHAQTLPQLSPAACLGFAADATPEHIHAVLQDLLLSACRGDNLLLTGAALNLYADGAADAEEYVNPTPAPRVSHATTQHPVPVTRAENLARAIVIFAHAFDEPSSRHCLLNVASHNMSRFLGPLLDHLPDNLAFLRAELREAVQFFYTKFAAVATEQMKQDFATRLICSLMRLASVDPSGISPYMHGMADAQIRLQACRMCLVQRFGVKDKKPNSPFDVSNVSLYLKIAPQKGRHNKAVPPLLNSLLMAWYEADDDKSFQFKTNHLENVRRLTRKLCSLRDRVPAFGASERDLNAFNAAVVIIASKISESNS